MRSPKLIQSTCAFFFLLLILVPLASFGQSSNGSISGSANDDSGGATPGVTVTVTNLATGATRTTVTTSTGHYELPLLPPGNYSVAAELAGFQTVKFGRIAVNVGSDTGLNFKMKPGVAETVTVTAAAPVIETT